MSNLKNFLHLFLMFSFFFGLVANLGAADNYLEKGIAEFKAENYEEALEFFEKAYKENPKDPQITSYLGLTQREMQNHQEAARFFKETININPEASEIKLLLADTFYNIGGYEDALKAVDGAISDGIKPAQSHYLKGLILLKLNRNAGAIGAFKKASELDPSLKQQSDFQIASIYVQEKKYKEAGDTFKGLITSDPTSDWAVFSKDYLAALEKMPPPYRLNVSFGYQYDDNVLAVPLDQSLVDITKQEDWKRIAGVLGEYTLFSKGPWNLRAAYSLNIVQYSKSDYTKSNGQKLFSQDTVSHIISIMPSYNTDKSITSLLLSYNYLEVDYAKYLQTFTVNPLYTFVISGNNLGQVFLKYKKQEYDADFLKIKLGTYLLKEEDKDSNNISGGLGYFYAFAKGNGLFNLKGELEQNDADGSNWDYAGSKLSTGFLYPFFENKLKANIFGEIYRQKFKNTHTIYNKKRRDNIVSAQTSLTYTVLKPLDVSVGYAHIKDDSNISVYEYRKNLYTVNLEYRF